jgi:hypothetical protein
MKYKELSPIGSRNADGLRRTNYERIEIERLNQGKERKKKERNSILLENFISVETIKL